MDQTLVRTLPYIIPRRTVKANTQAALILGTRGLRASQLQRLPPHDLRVDAALVVRHARVVRVVVELLLLHPRVNHHGRRHRLAASPHLVPAVLSAGEVREVAAHLVPLVPHQSTRAVGQ